MFQVAILYAAAVIGVKLLTEKVDVRWSGRSAVIFNLVSVEQSTIGKNAL